MSSINFYLDKPDRKNESPIFLVYQSCGRKFKYFTKEKFPSTAWEHERQKVKRNYAVSDSINNKKGRMKANEVALNSFLSQTKTQFIIPVYQRNYDWTEEQCRQLFYDILEVGNKPASTHFIGSIVFIHDGVYSSSEVRQLVVIDGQQRLTCKTQYLHVPF